MSDDVTLRQLINASLDRYPHNDDDSIAVDVLNALRVARKAALLLVPLVANEVAGVRRSEMRELERRAFPRRRTVSQSQLIEDAEPIDMLAARRELVQSGFWVQDGRHITWAKATVEEHEARIDWFRSHIAGCERTVEGHRYAMARIRAAGVTCLAELEDDLT